MIVFNEYGNPVVDSDFESLGNEVFQKAKEFFNQGLQTNSVVEVRAAAQYLHSIIDGACCEAILSEQMKKSRAERKIRMDALKAKHSIPPMPKPPEIVVLREDQIPPETRTEEHCSRCGEFVGQFISQHICPYLCKPSK